MKKRMSQSLLEKIMVGSVFSWFLFIGIQCKSHSQGVIIDSKSVSLDVIEGLIESIKLEYIGYVQNHVSRPSEVEAFNEFLSENEKDELLLNKVRFWNKETQCHIKLNVESFEGVYKMERAPLISIMAYLDSLKEDVKKVRENCK